MGPQAVWPYPSTATHGRMPVWFAESVPEVSSRDDNVCKRT